MKHFIVLLGLLCLFSCTKNPTPTNRASTSKQSDSLTLTVALMPTVDCIPFFYAQQSGIYDSLGLSVDFPLYRSQMDIDTALVGRSIDGGVTDIVRAEFLQSKGGKPVVVMATEGRWSVVASRSLRIHKFNQLKDRMVAVARHSVTDLISDLAAAEGGLADNQIYRPQINDIVLRTNMLDNTQIDVAVLPEPQATMAVTKGHRRLAMNNLKKTEFGCLAFDARVLKNKRRAAQVRALIKGYNLAIEAINRGGKAVCDSLLLTTFGLSPDDIRSLKLPRYEKAHLPSAEVIDQSRRFLQRRKFVSSRYDADKLIDRTYIK